MLAAYCIISIPLTQGASRAAQMFNEQLGGLDTHDVYPMADRLEREMDGGDGMWYRTASPGDCKSTVVSCF